MTWFGQILRKFINRDIQRNSELHFGLVDATWKGSSNLLLIWNTLTTETAYLISVLHNYLWICTPEFINSINIMFVSCLQYFKFTVTLSML